MATNDMDKSRATYGSFMNLLKWSVPVIALITLFVIVMIAD